MTEQKQLDMGVPKVTVTSGTPMLAVHFQGGNRFDNMLIDIAASCRGQDEWLKTVSDKKSIRQKAWLNWGKFLFWGFLQKKRLSEPFVFTGLVRGWFNEFERYWREILQGRPLTVSDFHGLRFSYRRQFQKVDSLSWDDNTQHVDNWQAPANINLIFTNIYDLAVFPVRYYLFFKTLQKGARVLEYGCSMAPGYRTYRKFFNHKKVRWVLADIRNFSYHFARYSYARDAEVEDMATIDPENFDDPLRDVEGTFDAIIIITVFEHLHKPRYIAEYLLNRLNKGGLLVFDYVKSEAKHLDSRAGLAERLETLKFLSENLDLVHGRLNNLDESVPLCVGRKK